MQFFTDDLIIQRIKKNIKGKKLKIVVPEGNENRIIKSLKYTPDILKILLGNKEEITQKIETEYEDKSKEILKNVLFYDNQEILTDSNIEYFCQKRNNKITKQEAREMLKTNPYIATLLVELGKADALVGGSYYSTKDILKPALQIIKSKDKIASSYFLMKKDNQTILFADCALNPNPTVEELQIIALQTIQTAQKLNLDPKAALLSYSTLGSGQGEAVVKIQKVYQEFSNNYPQYKHYLEGEFQFDAAFSKVVSKIKAKNSLIAGEANIFIFPDLNSGNIGYKIAEFMGGWEAIGPIIQGLNKSVNDLSRGTTPETIAKVMYLSLI